MRDLLPLSALASPEAVIVVGVIPAAGYATRLQPLPCSKEMVSVGGKPVMDYLIDRMRAGPCTELRVVTRADKQDVISHARRRGATVVLGRPKSVSESLLAGMAGLAADDIVLFGFPDTIWEPEDGYARLVARVLEGHDLALGIFESGEPERSDVVVLSGSDRIARVDVKPVAPSSSWVWGCGAARVRALTGLADYDEPGHYFHVLCRDRGVVGVRLAHIVDIGTPEALQRYKRSRRMSGRR